MNPRFWQVVAKIVASKLFDYNYLLQNRISPSRCTLAKATDQHHESSLLRGSFWAFGPQGEVLLDGLNRI